MVRDNLRNSFPEKSTVELVGAGLPPLVLRLMLETIKTLTISPSSWRTVSWWKEQMLKSYYDKALARSW